METTDAPAEAPALLATIEGRCAFYDAEAQRCAVQRALDHDALPLACRQFPRISVRDPRGVSVTLSHYCPTAEGLLESATDAAIAINAPALPAGGEYVGLDATASLPPLLRPDMLMDWESWWEWERLTVELLANRAEPPGVVLARLNTAVEHARTWNPADGPLLTRIREAFDAAHHAAIDSDGVFAPDVPQRRDEILGAIPVAFRPAAATTARTHASPKAIARLLAAHAFANWTAHLGRGLRTWLRSVEAPLVLVQSGLDIRTADLWLRHLVEPKTLAGTWSRVEARRVTPLP